MASVAKVGIGAGVNLATIPLREGAKALSGELSRETLSRHCWRGESRAWIEVRADELAEFAQRARAGAFDGFNVTTPHKEAIIASIDDLSDEARAARAVNVVRRAERSLSGHNTDGSGFIAALRDIWDWL